MTQRDPILPRLAISQDLWRADEDLGFLRVLPAIGVDGLVVSPSQISDGYVDMTGDMSKFTAYKALLKALSIEPVAMQSIIPAGSKGRIFDTKERQKELLDRISYSCEVANAMEIGTITFGQPDLRHGAFYDVDADFQKGVDFFCEVSRIGQAHDLRIMVEPSPREYGCDFGCNLFEVSDLLSNVSPHEGLGIHLNTSSLLLEEGMIKAGISAHGGSSHHIDVSDPFYRPLGAESIQVHEHISCALHRMWSIGHGPGWVVASGKRPRDVAEGALMARIMEAVECVRTLYLPNRASQV